MVTSRDTARDPTVDSSNTMGKDPEGTCGVILLICDVKDLKLTEIWDP